MAADLLASAPAAKEGGGEGAGPRRSETVPAGGAAAALAVATAFLLVSLCLPAGHSVRGAAPGTE